jgi:hypothetical protein
MASLVWTALANKPFSPYGKLIAFYPAPPSSPEHFVTPWEFPSSEAANDSSSPGME